MQNATTLNVRISALGKPDTTGQVQYLEYSKEERTKRALKFGGGSWGLALATAVIPIVHFILVPTFFIAGPIVAYIVLKRKAMILGGEGTCPSCGKAMKIERSMPNFPLSDVCNHCHKTVEINKA